MVRESEGVGEKERAELAIGSVRLTQVWPRIGDTTNERMKLFAFVRELVQNNVKNGMMNKEM